MEQWRDTLIKHPFFSEWRPIELDALLERCTLRAFTRGDALWTVGDPADSAFVLLSGRIERTRTVQPDGHLSQQFGTPGDWLSLTALLHAVEHSSAATPLERTEVLELTRGDFEELFAAGHPAAYRLADAIAAAVVEEMRDSNRRVHQVFGQPAETLRMLRRRMREESL